MRTKPQHIGIAALLIVLAASAVGQASSATPQELQNQPQPALASDAQTAPAASVVTPSIQALIDFKDSDVKFDLRDLMDTLRDRRHEGWVLAAYPDPKTHRPLIGAGFSLDLPARDHPQRDPVNPHPFLEPSSADLWQAAGLEPERLTTILSQFRDRFPAPVTRRHRIKFAALEPQITDDEATLLLRIAAIQAIYNARGYCRNFDALAPSQQMALSQLVYQMGVNLDEFSEFLKLINAGSSSSDAGAAAPSSSLIATDSEYWHGVQQSLIHSQWARLYRTRAVAVIAMLDPRYQDDPVVAERRVGATLHPAVVHRRRGRAAASRQLASSSGSRAKTLHPKPSRTRVKRQA
jgi:hypothetical protein